MYCDGDMSMAGAGASAFAAALRRGFRDGFALALARFFAEGLPGRRRVGLVATTPPGTPRVRVRPDYSIVLPAYNEDRRATETDNGRRTTETDNGLMALKRSKKETFRVGSRPRVDTTRPGRRRIEFRPGD
jgi:hypothetical protein